MIRPAILALAEAIRATGTTLVTGEGPPAAAVARGRGRAATRGPP